MADDKAFTGSIPKIYETHLVPLIFQACAADLARRVAGRNPGNVLELAAGTGVVTRALLGVLPPRVDVIATDLNTAMLDQAAAHTLPRPVAFQQADAMALPFDDQTFDAVVIQFGVMFFPDKPKALSEARRGSWSGRRMGISIRPASRRTLPPAGSARRRSSVTVTERSRANNASDPAVGYCHGSPLRAEIESRGALEHATDAAEKAIEKRFGGGPIDAKIQAMVVTVAR